jgi:hypothetical protein
MSLYLLTILAVKPLRITGKSSSVNSSGKREATPHNSGPRRPARLQPGIRRYLRLELLAGFFRATPFG